MALLLVVDDYPPLLAMLEMMLRAAGHEVVTAPDGVTAFELARRERPDLVLLDVDMPWLDGVEVCAALKREAGFERVPILLMSGRLSPQVLARAREAGACGALPKPFFREALLAEIKAVLQASAPA